MISIITITFNNYSELRTTLDSLKDISNIESIVVNGGSCEKTREFLKNYPGKSVSEKDNGISDAFNKGLRIASGDAILFLNSGDKLVDPSYLLDASRYFFDNPKIDFIYADIILDDPLAGPLLLKSINKLPSMPFNHPTLIVRKKIVAIVGEFNLKYKIAMDLDFVYRMLKITRNGCYFEKAVVLMDGNGVSSTKHHLMILEKFKIVFENKDFSCRTFFLLCQQFTYTLLKIVLQFFKLDFFIAKVRAKKYGVKDI